MDIAYSDQVNLNGGFTMDTNIEGPPVWEIQTRLRTREVPEYTNLRFFLPASTAKPTNMTVIDTNDTVDRS